MTREEKAQAYDEALERARKQKYDYQKEFDKTDKNSQLAEILRAGISAIELAFPELAESEDERIRKELLDAVDKARVFDIDKDVADRWTAWLEKQKEHIPYIDFVIKTHKGSDTNPYDMRVSEAQEYAIKRGFGIPFNDGEVYVDERHMTQTIGNILRWADEHPKEQKPAEWSEEDEKMRNALWNLLKIYYAQDYSMTCLGIEAGKFRNWLKDLHPSWKPSGE